MTAKELLKKYWHFETFKPLQEEIIGSVLGGWDTLALLPTGGGKSLCYQIPALASEGLTIVVTPLISLIKDQVTQLRNRNIPATCVISGMSRQEIEMVLNRCIFSNIKLLYISPERIRSRMFIEHFKQMKINLIAVDEAHCISQWGYDFRPPYLEIAKLREYHPKAPVIALTATATPKVVNDIINKLSLFEGVSHANNFRIIQGSFFRNNISYSVFHENNKQGRLLRILQNTGGSSIVYVRNRRRTAEIAKLLNDKGISAHYYHAGLTMKERNQKQQDWMASEHDVMVATNAFGMGIDKANVRAVVHYDIPESIEAYFQEAGRAGRDGKRAYSVILYDDNDILNLKQRIDKDYPSIKQIKNVYHGLCNYYQIPVGSGTDSRFDFKADDICRMYDFEIYTFFSSLKFLEREGLISLPEQSELLSRLHINIDKEELYRFQVSNKKSGEMLAMILRLYGGLFSDYVAINEKAISKRCGATEIQVINLLSELNRLQIVEYRKRSVNPQIVFSSPRIDIHDLYISDKNYKELRDEALKRQEAMIGYIENHKVCRSRQLLAYFGEKKSSDCGNCDICLSRRQPPLRKIDLETKILEILQDNSMTLQELAEKATGTDKDSLIKTVRTLLDKNKLLMDQDFRISRNNS